MKEETRDRILTAWLDVLIILIFVTIYLTRDMGKTSAIWNGLLVAALGLIPVYFVWG